MNFTFHQLKIFLEVAKYENVTKAAEELFMTQPALSIQLKNFQSQFEIPLFDKIGKRIYLTDFGRSITKIAEKILSEADELEYQTRKYEGLLTGKLTISSASTGKYVIPYFLSSFIHQHPGIDLTLDVSNKTKVMKGLKENEVDFAVVSVVPDKLDVEEELLVDNKLYLVGKKKKFDSKYPLIYREEGSATRGAMEKYFGDPSQRKSIELTSNEAVKQAVVAGLGYSILPLIGMRNELNTGQLNIISRRGLPIVTHWRIIWLKNKKLSPVCKTFLSHVREHKDKIIQEQFQKS